MSGEGRWGARHSGLSDDGIGWHASADMPGSGIMSETYDLAVIGAGPAGMEAAIAAVETGVKTVLIDSLLREGGQYYRKLPAAFTAIRKSPCGKRRGAFSQTAGGRTGNQNL